MGSQRRSSGVPSARGSSKAVPAATMISAQNLLHYEAAQSNMRGLQADFENEAHDNRPRAISASSSDHRAHTDSTHTVEGIPELEVLDRETQKLMQIIQNLRHLGVERYVLPLPKICVVGDQSTGKSSLIEALSDLKSPRAADACTRCPLELNLTKKPNKPWRCEVFLTKKFTYDRDPRGAKVTRNRQLGPWKEQDTENIPFGVLSSKDQVAESLKWAQIAILNPDKDPNKYMAGSKSGMQATHRVQFSPNVVRLDISGPTLPNLSFYDLPGVINHDEAEFIPKVTQNLVKQYINAENCIILLTQTMNHDAANSCAASIVKEMKRQDRTIGILTKPDLLGTEAVTQFREILNGNRYHLAKGYHVVKNEADATIENSIARENEKQFFKTDQRFAVQLAEFSDRFGTERLADRLSKMLAEEIQASLPHISEQVDAKIRLCKEELNGLPRPPGGNIVSQVHFKIGADFHREIEKRIGGGSFEDSFFSNWFKEFSTFRTKLVYSFPNVVFPPFRQMPQFTDNRNSAGPSGSRPTPAFNADDHETIIIDPDTDNSVPVSPSRPGRRKKLKVERVRELTQCINQGVIGCGDPRVTDKLHAEGIEHWPNLADEFLDLSFSMCAQTLEKSVEVAFKEWRATRLFDMVRSTVQTYLRDTWQSQSNLIGVLWDMESNKVMIGDEEAIKHRKAENYKILKRRWINIRTNELTVGKEAQKGTQKKSLQLTATEKEEIEADARAEPLAWDDELQQIATSRAYYYYAANRYADNIGSAIRTACFDNCRNKLCSVLAKELRLNSTENEANTYCRKLLAVDPKIEERREYLESSINDLEKAREEFDKLAIKKDSYEADTSSDYSMED